MLHHLRLIPKLLLFSVLVFASDAGAQLDQAFGQLFNTILRDRIVSTGPLAALFDSTAVRARDELIPALNNLVASNVASFPLPSTVSGITIDFSKRAPEIISESLGPIFVETAQTVGRMKLNLGVNASYFSLNRFRGLNTDDFAFTFFAGDLDGDEVLGTGQLAPLETETVDVFPAMDLNAGVFVLFGTFGVLDNLDLGFAVPLISLQLKGEATAVINSTTFFAGGAAEFSFNGDPFNPALETTVPYEESATGLGDLSLRLKYRFLDKPGVNMAVFADIRLPTGDEQNFMGTGHTNARFSWLVSRHTPGFSPHASAGYEYRGADFDSDRFAFTAGFDQKLSSDFTFAADVLGRIDLSSNKIVVLPGSVLLNFDRTDFRPDPPANFQRRVERSNLPEDNRDNQIDASFGIKFSPSERALFFANVLLPLNNGGLRSSIAPTLGASVTF